MTKQPSLKRWRALAAVVLAFASLGGMPANGADPPGKGPAAKVRIAIPSEEQSKAYISMLLATAGLAGEISPASIFDFSPAAEAGREMGAKK